MRPGNQGGFTATWQNEEGGQDTLIQSVAAVATMGLAQQHRNLEAQRRLMSGREKMVAMRDVGALRSLPPDALVNCPLCNDWLPPLAFEMHGAECSKVRAPRRRFWVPAGIKNALGAFPEKRGGV